MKKYIYEGKTYEDALEKALQELAQSIKQHGIIMPLLVQRIGDRYQIIAGERRFRAARLAGLKVNLSTSLKSLKEEAKEFIDKVANEVKLIELEEQYSNEILLEYQNNGLDYTKAKLEVITKHKQLEELAKQREVVQEVVKEEEQIQEVIETITAPREVKEPEEILECQFKVKGTMAQIKAIKNYLNELGVSYE